VKVLFQNRSDADTHRGGDTVQMEKTGEHLARYGVTVDISLAPEPPVAGYDIVHVFNVQTSAHGVLQCRNAKQSRTPLVLSTIFWDPRPARMDPYVLRYAWSRAGRTLATVAPRVACALAPLTTRLPSSRSFKAAKEMLWLADLLLPNSHAELEGLAHYFSAPWVRCKGWVVPNAVDPPRRPEIDGVPASLEALPSGQYVLQVGRIEPVKNQLRLLQALLPLPELPLVFVGRAACEAYAEACYRLATARGNTWFIPEIEHDVLPHVYQRAKVHVLASLRESPGLATLEAAVWGANCVVSHHGPVTEYFSNAAWCCDPSDVSSVQGAVRAAWDALPRSDLGERIRREYTWDQAAARTYAAYTRLLQGYLGSGPHHN
jgi:glycosyltransferase involved in cell wall biosynthesis